MTTKPQHAGRTARHAAAASILIVGASLSGSGAALGEESGKIECNRGEPSLGVGLQMDNVFIFSPAYIITLLFRI